MVTNSVPNFSNRIFNNMMGVPKPASLKRQAQWKTFSPLKKRVEPFLHLDADRDGTPDRWDCEPLNWKRQDTKEKQIMKGRHWTTTKKLHPYQDNLKVLAQQSPSKKVFTQSLSMGEITNTPWHITREKNFKIDPNKGSTDMSSMSTGKTEKGTLMFTGNLPLWDSHYNKYDYDWKTKKDKYETSKEADVTRPYAALLDTTQAKDNEDYWNVQRGFGDEKFVPDANKIKVKKVYKIEEARALDKELGRKFNPETEEEAELFYDIANAEEEPEDEPIEDEPEPEDEPIEEDYDEKEQL